MSAEGTPVLPAQWVRAGEFYGSSALLRVPSVVNTDERKDESKSGQWRSQQSACTVAGEPSPVFSI